MGYVFPGSKLTERDMTALCVKSCCPKLKQVNQRRTRNNSNRKSSFTLDEEEDEDKDHGTDT
jgi:hypothetical protein